MDAWSHSRRVRIVIWERQRTRFSSEGPGSLPCRGRGFCSALVGTIVASWHEHASRRRRDPQHWPVQLAAWHAYRWCAQLRLRAGNIAFRAGRTGTHVTGGQPALRWHDTVRCPGWSCRGGFSRHIGFGARFVAYARTAERDSWHGRDRLEKEDTSMMQTLRKVCGRQTQSDMAVLRRPMRKFRASFTPRTRRPRRR